MPQDFSEISFLIISATILALLMIGFITFMVFLHRTRQLKHRHDLQEARRQFEEAILHSRLEMQEQTLNHISREIHDNIAQVLSFVKLSLNMSKGVGEEERAGRIEESKGLLSQAINDLKDLSKSYSLQQIQKLGLNEAVRNECERLNRSGSVWTELTVKGEAYRMQEDTELVLFRIFQEGLTNAVKYSGTGSVQISLSFEEDSFTLNVSDKGRGFDPMLPPQGSGMGLANIRTRAALIGAEAKIDSQPGAGCSITIKLKRDIQ